MCKTTPELYNIMHNLQLRYYVSSMFRPCSGHLQGAHISYMYKNRFYVNKLGENWVLVLSNCLKFAHNLCFVRIINAHVLKMTRRGPKPVRVVIF